MKSMTDQFLTDVRQEYISRSQQRQEQQRQEQQRQEQQRQERLRQERLQQEQERQERSRQERLQQERLRQERQLGACAMYQLPREFQNIVQIGQQNIVQQKVSEKLRSRSQHVDRLKVNNDEQNVHQSCVINTSRNVLKKQGTREGTVDQREIAGLFAYIEEKAGAQKRVKAMYSAEKMIQSRSMITAYGQTEDQILMTTYEAVREKNNDNITQQFIDALYEISETITADQENDRVFSVCATGRVVRLLDCLARCQESLILSDQAVHELVLTQLQTLAESDAAYQKNGDKSQLADTYDQYLTKDLLEPQIITHRQYTDFKTWLTDL